MTASQVRVTAEALRLTLNDLNVLFRTSAQSSERIRVAHRKAEEHRDRGLITQEKVDEIIARRREMRLLYQFACVATDLRAGWSERSVFMPRQIEKADPEYMMDLVRDRFERLQEVAS